MKELKKMTLTMLLAAGLFAGASLNTQADSLSSKDVVLRTVIATPASAKVSGQSVDAALYSSKTAQTVSLNQRYAAKAKVSGQPIDAAAYNSKGR